MSAANPNIINSLNAEWEIAVPDQVTEEDLLALLSMRINELIRTDMQRLISILYRIDVDEKKIRNMLREHKGTDAGLIIAHLVLERQKQKIKTREMFNSRVDDISDEERW